MADPTTPYRDHHRGPDRDVDRSWERRDLLRMRHSRALTALMNDRSELRGVHPLADLVDDAVRWSA